MVNSAMEVYVERSTAFRFKKLASSTILAIGVTSFSGDAESGDEKETRTRAADGPLRTPPGIGERAGHPQDLTAHGGGRGEGQSGRWASEGAGRIGFDRHGDRRGAGAGHGQDMQRGVELFGGSDRAELLPGARTG